MNYIFTKDIVYKCMYVSKDEGILCWATPTWKS